MKKDIAIEELRMGPPKEEEEDFEDGEEQIDGLAIEEDLEEQGQHPGKELRYSKEVRFLRALKWSLIVVIPVLIFVFTLREVKHRNHALVKNAEAVTVVDSAAVSWRLDTAKNYTMDTQYWMNEPRNQERHYYFNISTLEGRNPDGMVRNLTVVNGQYPAPLIEANAGDTLFIHVSNQMSTEPVTIHCHGLFYNKKNSFQDGASFINQCPIPPEQSYVYEIELDDDQFGTYWYHSHYGSQYADGLFGPLVIHSQEELDMIDTEYDQDIVVVVSDYYHDISTNYLEEYLGPDNENTEPDPDNGLIQGANFFDYVESRYLAPNGESVDDLQYSPVSVTMFNLDPDSTYRVRLVNAGFFLPFEFEIDRHMLEIIESDGTLVDPLTVESLSVSVAQRYSFILQPLDSKEDLKNYWLHANFNQFCSKEVNRNFNHIVTAVVTYTGARDASDLEIPASDWNYNGGQVQCREFDQSLLKTKDSDLKVPIVQNGSHLPDLKIDLDVSFFIGAYQKTRGYFIDHTYVSYDKSSSMYELVTNPNDNPIKSLENDDLMTFNEDQFMINLNQRGAVVDFVINNYDDGAHPFHLHGHKFWILRVGDTGYFDDSYYNEDSNEMNFENAVLRDTFNIPGFGWAVIRFVVDNPGVWPFHCHIGWHMESGLLLQVNALQEEYTSWNNYPEEWKSLCSAKEGMN